MSEKLTIPTAEQKIAEILKQLEIDQNMVVEGIGCEAVEITALEDFRRNFKMAVVIELQRQPGRMW